jgi:hypothetical protein
MKVLTLAVFMATVGFPALADATLDAVVSANYPADLHAFAVVHHLQEKRQQAYGTLTVGGIEYIVAAYSNGEIGAVVLLEKTDGTYVADQEMSRPLSGTKPAVTTEDLDHDGTYEAVVRFDTSKGNSQTWIYKVLPKQLQVISPRNTFGGSELMFPDMLDFTGEGVMDLVEDHVFGSVSDPTVRHDHYVLSNGTYVAAEPLDYYGIFYRSKAAPAPETVTFSISPSAVGKPYRLSVLNGGASGKDFRVASGTIAVNGIIVSPPSDFSESRTAWTVPVTLQEQNTVTVTVGGKLGGRIGVAIRHD